MDRIPCVLPRLEDHRLEACFITETFASWVYKSIPDPRSLLEQGLKHFDYFRDVALQGVSLINCSYYIYMRIIAKFYLCVGLFYLDHDDDLGQAKTFSGTALSLAKSSGAFKEQCATLSNMALMQWRTGDYSGSQRYAREVQELAQWAGDLLAEAKGARLE